MARRILDSITYTTLATGDEQGRPWAHPIRYAPASPTDLLWVSDRSSSAAEEDMLQKA